jgi:hypothetical protein
VIFLKTSPVRRKWMEGERSNDPGSKGAPVVLQPKKRQSDAHDQQSNEFAVAR